ncbi:Polysaccharide biosynthesis glycosyl transferase CpsJ [uncultured Synechococcales cyanobacterium]|uniref:Polysaccharide biosynthesis glycosyl transferase CpsJ n=1 Tax=uncultured Synechococcales cyanobacterium TaxID=1936017 RepID=A0A6J4V418_9CYAN|nr:Polysaccharide biosynthesis glycosyl transferase CpsJ [uncultured Synechococcales cyanobacterium]
MEHLPQVSVVVPAYNVRGYIADALVSLQQQSLGEFEALIVDDGSTDGTRELVEQFCQRDSRFHLLSKPNGGLSSARNYGIRHAQTDYIALLDGDDRYAADKLATHLAVLQTNPTVGVVYSASQTIREDGRPTPMHLSGKPIHPDPLLALLCKNFVGHGSNAVFRRCLCAEVGEFDESLRSNEDVDFWLRVAALSHWRFYREPRALCYYRVRPSGLSFNVEQMQCNRERVIAAAYERSPHRVGPMLPTAHAYLYRYLARLSLTAGDAAKAQNYIHAALAADRSIFWRDPRSLTTLAAVRLSSLAGFWLRRSLGSAQSTPK